MSVRQRRRRRTRAAFSRESVHAHPRLCNLHPRAHHIALSLSLYPYLPSVSLLRPVPCALRDRYGFMSPAFSLGATRKFASGQRARRRIHSAEIVTLRFFSLSAIPSASLWLRTQGTVTRDGAGSDGDATLRATRATAVPGYFGANIYED